MRALPRSAGTDVAAQCFLNALLRETKDWRYLPATAADALPNIHIPLSQTQALRVPVRYFSPTQHHQYRFPATLIQSNSDTGDAVTFPQLVDLVLEKPSVKGSLDADTLARFKQRVLESHAHTWQAIDLRHGWANLRDKPLTFADAEQALLVGHAFHPAPKSHEPFNEAEARRYLPDFASRFPLRWFAVESTLVAGDSLNVSLRERLLRFAAQSAPELLGHFTDTRWLLPMHPWQADYLLEQDWCQRLAENGSLQDLGEAGAQWLPTSSSRSLYSETNSDMIKFSLSVRLTNSVRTLSVKEVKRGMRLARLAKTERWQDLQARYPTMRVMQEDGWAGLRDESGVIQEESLMALRVNLLFDTPDTQTNVLVSLTQAARCWLDAYCDRVLLPLFSAEADYGLVLLAHQQNILVEMQQDFPVGLIYRDCQGSAWTEGADAWLKEAGETEVENRFGESQLLRYFPYYLLLNSTLAVTAALAAAGFDSEENLMSHVRDALAELRRTAKQTRCLDYVLDSPTWNCKGNFFCYLHDRNENTIADPAVIYFDFSNPFYKEKA
ncbi:TPA: IucA/IucC family siderophore biosynthesis protein [Enterobacter asburiae]|uniref:IucA/IucC family protein n=1 Tax=Enterobacter asburiae TaxID=61645 RepID=UPI001F3EDD2A|nr:IucA/IucC family protein [Enterobacter asburiae]MCF1339872.1 IucA/IucC family siderophore biosynthesis protein [Enterobacter asburiae]MCM6996339.1 IucA/IucC family siderophore biosynthesis protein [Enterobacter asburiae]MCQ4338253.1 IucA/IucC family siderophore biosynthesis protein [Enterobacter asburiae]HDC4533616.1 IucA/IucC family siderophore biosynthesis protein [Enterobacter asburiae]HDC4564749.1 IucA/IucC family siderophore biosynthesis protein [Enterobacter asburiae]